MGLIHTRTRRSSLQCPLCRDEVAYDQALVACPVCRASQHSVCVHELGPCHATPFRCESSPWWSPPFEAYDVACFVAVALACSVLWGLGHTAFLAPAYLAFAFGGVGYFKRSLVRGWRERGTGYEALGQDSVALISLLGSAVLIVFALFYL